MIISVSEIQHSWDQKNKLITNLKSRVQTLSQDNCIYSHYLCSQMDVFFTVSSFASQEGAEDRINIFSRRDELLMFLKLYLFMFIKDVS